MSHESISQSPQKAEEELYDFIDQRLFDYLHQQGVIERPDEQGFSRQELLNIARNTYLYGAFDREQNPAIMEKAMNSYTSKKAKESGRPLGA